MLNIMTQIIQIPKSIVPIKLICKSFSMYMTQIVPPQTFQKNYIIESCKLSQNFHNHTKNISFTNSSVNMSVIIRNLIRHAILYSRYLM